MAGREWQRVIAHVDLDAFYSQVEVKLHPYLKGKPVGVSQYNPFGDLSTMRPDQDRLMNETNGSLIAVSYEARKFGVKRNMRCDEARKLCADLQVVQVPTAHGKADLTAYRAAGKQVQDILAEGCIAERASIDECYLDVTELAHSRLKRNDGLPECPPAELLEQMHICGSEGSNSADWWARPAEAWTAGERALAAGAAAVADARKRVEQQLGYSCSAGIAPTKILAKLTSGLHKPRQQTVLCLEAIPGLLKDLPIPKLRQLGGKFGEQVMQELGISTVGELRATPQSRLDSVFGEEKGGWLARLAEGLDDEPVKQRMLPKSIGCSKTFRGKNSLRTLPDVKHWLQSVGEEVEERLQEDRAANNRTPQLLTLGVATTDGWGQDSGSFSRSCQLRRPTAAAIAEDALGLIKRWAGSTHGWKIYGLSLSTSNFAAAPTGKSTLARFLKPNCEAMAIGGGSAKRPALELASSPPLARKQRVEATVATSSHPVSGGHQLVVDSSAQPDQQEQQPQLRRQQRDGRTAALQHLEHSDHSAACAQQQPFSNLSSGAAQQVVPHSDNARAAAAAAQATMPQAAGNLWRHASETDQDDLVIHLNLSDVASPTSKPLQSAHRAQGTFAVELAGTSAPARSQPSDSSGADIQPSKHVLPDCQPRNASESSQAAVHRPQHAATFAAEPLVTELTPAAVADRGESGSWMPASLQEVDAAVLSELPLDLQAEIKASLRARSSQLEEQHQLGASSLHRFFRQQPSTGQLKQNATRKGTKKRRSK